MLHFQLSVLNFSLFGLPVPPSPRLPVFRSPPRFPWRYRIISRCSPRVAVQNAVGGQQKTLEGSMNLDSINGILRTGRNMPAGSRCQGRDGCPVKIDRQQYDLYQNPPNPFCDFLDHLTRLKLFIPPIQDEVTQNMNEMWLYGIDVLVIFCCSARYNIQTFHNFPSFPTFTLKATVCGD